MRASHRHHRRFLPGILIWVVALAPFTSMAQEGQTHWEQLAAYWAPLIAQSTRHECRTDVLTSFDFDGDWNGANNAQGGRAMPMIGDADDGYVLDLGNREQTARSFVALGALLFDRSDFKALATKPSEYCYWLLGKDTDCRWSRIAPASEVPSLS